jgi:hypothetical protein
VLIAATALLAGGCEGKRITTPTMKPGTTPTVLGTGEKSFNLVVTDIEGKETFFEIHTDKKTVGEALFENKLIDGSQGQYGLYIKTVNGITVDYDVDKKYWAFYINGEYATSGVDTTDITDGATYTLKVE